MEIIAEIHTDYPEKFGIPKQAGIVADSVGTIRFCGKYNVNEAVKGLENYDYIWILWQFDGPVSDNFTPTVRPPVLGGNKYEGVFATRSPNRPNHIGMSSVRLKSVELTEKGPVLTVLGADMRDGTKIYDIKPYIPRDIHEISRHGIATDGGHRHLEIQNPDLLWEKCGEYANIIAQILQNDPRPAFHKDSDRIYGVKYANFNIKFTVKLNHLTVVAVEIL